MDEIGACSRRWPGFPRGSCALPRVLGRELSAARSSSGVFLGGPAGSQPLSCTDPLGSTTPASTEGIQPPHPAEPPSRGMSWGSPFSHPRVGLCSQGATPRARVVISGVCGVIRGAQEVTTGICGVAPKIHEVTSGVHGLSHRGHGQSCAQGVPGGCWVLAVPGGIGVWESPPREGFIPGTRPCTFWGTGGRLQGHPWAAAECGGSLPSSSSRLPVL